MSWTDELEKAFNEQITREFASSYEYLAMAAWLEEAGFPGMAGWMRAQSTEEWAHAMRFYRFVLDRDGSVSLGAIPAPRAGYGSPLDVFSEALRREGEITASIDSLYALALDSQDFASVPILDWFVAEQVEEEATVRQIVDDLERAGEEGHALLMLDRELGERAAAGEGTQG